MIIFNYQMATFAATQKLKLIQPDLVPIPKKKAAKKKRQDKIKCQEEIADTWNHMRWTARCKAIKICGEWGNGACVTEEYDLVCCVDPNQHHALKLIYGYNTRGLTFYRMYLDDECHGCTND